MVSVVIPTYNSLNYIGEAIDSVLSQTYRSLEILVIDDGSTDGTRRMVQERYPQVRYHQVPHRGASHARNYGIGQATGELIAFLDADDRWLPTKLEKQVALLEARADIGMVFTENLFFNDTGIVDIRLDKRKRLMQGDVVRNIFLNSYVATPTVMVRRRVFHDVGLFDEELKVAEDDNMWMRIGLKFGIELIDEPLVMCRITRDSLTNTSGNIFQGVLRHLELIGKRYPELARHLGERTVNRKCSRLYFSEGYYHFFNQDLQKARSFFTLSHRKNRFTIKPLLYLLFTFVPPEAVVRMRGVKRLLRRSAPTAKN